MTRRSIGLVIAGLAIAGVTGGIVGVQITGGPESPREVRQVSDEGGLAPATAPASPATVASPAPAAAKPTRAKPEQAPERAEKPAKEPTKKSENRSQTVTDDPAPEPEPTQTEDEQPQMPAPGPAPSDPRRCYNDEGIELQCPR